MEQLKHPLINFNLTAGEIILAHKIYTDNEALLHGRLMTCTCCCLIQISVLMQRHMKTFKYISFIHGFLGLTSCFLILFSFFNFYKEFYVPDPIFRQKAVIHIRLGFAICALMITQVGLGALTKILIIRKKSMYLLLLTRKVHHMVGWFLTLASFLNVHLGWSINNSDVVEFYIYPAYAIIGSIYVISELNRRKKTHRPHTYKNSILTSRSSGSELISSSMTYPQFLSEIRKANKKWVFFNDLVLDVTSFITSHPGGSYLIDGIIGEDSAKYLYGVTNYSKDIPPNIHSFYALNLTKEFAFNKVCLPYNIICSQAESRIPLKTTWNVLEKTKITSTMTCIELYSSDLFLNSAPFGCDWMGYHFRVKQNGLKRFYSLVVVNLVKWSNEVKDLNLPVHLNNYQSSVVNQYETLKLYVKDYPKGNVSKYLSELANGDQLSLKGPYGPGLGISKFPKGPCLAFGAGTGVLVFLDLVHAIWKEASNEQFQLFLYVSFSSRDDAIGLDLLEATQKRFKNKIKLQVNLDREKFGVRLTRDNIKHWVSDKLKKIWVCGPASFSRFTEEILESHGVERKKILIL